MSFRIWTIGHSTRTLDELLAVLAAYDIEAVADVRRFPGSRRLPHVQEDVLREALEGRGIAYVWLPALGGRRRSRPGHLASAWRNPAFQAYAEHLITEEFAAGLVELLMIAHGLRTVVMCAEALWWRCHRRLVADVLVSLGIDVVHIRDTGHAEHHRLAAPAVLVAGRLAYPGDG
jgi:uncharacterized protein (DUF488 family)